MKKTRIVLIPVDYHNSRKVCEQIQEQSFKTVNELNIELTNKLNPDDKQPLIMCLNDFMDAVNDQDLDVLTEYFISYVTIEN